MDLSPFISSDPATRGDGWSPERKTRFLERLAANGNVRAACAAVGMSRESAYTLRRRDPLFARGWGAALVRARESGAEVLADRAIDGIEEEVWYRGELRGTRRRYDGRLLLAHLARLDRLVEQAPGAVRDAERFEEMLGRVAGAEAPAELAVDGEPLPLDRETTIEMAQDEARETVEAAWADRVTDPENPLTGEQHEAYLDERHAALERARAEAGARWDAWFERVCRAVDAALAAEPAAPGDAAGADAAADSPETVSEVSGSPRAATFVGPDGRRYARA